MDIFDNEEGKARLIITIRIMLAAILWLLARFVLTGSFQTAAFALSYLTAGYDIVLEALEGLVKFKWTDEELLMTVASMTAFFTGEAEESVMVMLLYQLGELLTDIAVSRSQKNIEQLLQRKKEMAHWLLDGQVIEIEADRIAAGMLLQINQGERIIVPGTVKEGSSALDMRAIDEKDTELKEVNAGDELTVGAVNAGDVLVMETSEAYSDPAAGHITEVVENCRNNDSGKTEGTLNKFIRFYTPFVMIAAILIAAFGPMVTSISYRESVQIACTLLVISCPCALVISIPLAFFCGVGNAGKKGILVKGAEYLEALNAFDYLGLEKGKLLTNGEYEVQDVESSMEEEKLLKLCASMVRDIDDPLYKAITEKYGEGREYSILRNIEINDEGIKARIGNKDYFLGSYDFICNNTAEKPEEKNGNVLYFASRKENLGVIVFNERIIQNTADILKELKRNNVNQVNIFTSEPIRKNVQLINVDGIDLVLGDTDEQRKIAELQRAHQKGKKTAFIGNSGDDVAVMQAADVGIALAGLSTEAVIAGSDVVLMSNELSPLVMGRKIAARTVGIVRQNLGFIIACKVLFIIMSLMGTLPMWMAVFADVGVTLITVLNSARLLRIK